MESIVSIGCELINNEIKPELYIREIASLVSDKKVVILKRVFREEQLIQLRNSVIEWGEHTESATQDNFKSNYHSMKVKVSNIQKTPHVFHDYNFNDFGSLPQNLSEKMNEVFEPLRIFYNSLTGYNANLGLVEKGPYFHPQLIHYPVGGGFFGRHSHNLLPQKIGFILSMSRHGKDYSAGGTCFVMNNEVVDIEGHHDIGDLCLFRFDVDHWVKQSPLNDVFTWNGHKGRWVATLAYFDPFG